MSNSPKQPKAPEIDFGIPPRARVESGEIRLAKHLIWVAGLASDTVGDVTVDGKIALIQQHPYPDLYLCPIRPHTHPSYLDAWFYCDCLAYDHDVPALVYPQRSELAKWKYRYMHPGHGKVRDVMVEGIGEQAGHKIPLWPLSPSALVQKFYMQQLCAILDEARELRHGPVTCVYFRYYKEQDRIDLAYSQSYGTAAQEIHLYATALRQADTLSEYLCYYRVIESATGSNGRVWIERSLARLKTHDFGSIPFSDDDLLNEGPRNLLAEYRRRALRRLNTLLRAYATPSGVADYLYGVNRCGIAHGQTIVRAEIAPGYFEVVRDTYLLKMLARMAIDETIVPPRRG